MRHLLHLIALLALPVAAFAQPMQLATSFVSNNGCGASFFNVQSTGGADIVVVGLDCNIDAGMQNVEVWTRAGTHVGFEASMAGWTMIASAPGLVSLGLNIPTPIPVVLNVMIPAGQTQAFVIGTTNGNFMNYTNSPAGSTVGVTPWATDAFATIYAGTGQCVPLLGGAPINLRNVNCNLYYTTDCLGSCFNPRSLTPTVIGLPSARSSDNTVTIDTSSCATDNSTPSCNAGGDDAILRVVAPFTGSAIVDTCRISSFDTVLHVLDGTCGAAELTCASSDSCGAGGEQVTFNIVAGNAYFVVVDGAGGATGTADVRVQLTEVPTAYVPCPGVEPNSIAVANLRPVAIERLALISAGMGGEGQVAWQPCYQQYYAFDLGAPSNLYEVFSPTGAPVSTSSSVGLDGRGLYYNPGTGNVELVTFNAVAAGGAADGLFTVGLDAGASFTGMNTQVLVTVPGLAGMQTAPAFDYDRDLLYSREGTDTVNVVARATGAFVSSFMLDSASAGSPVMAANGIAYTGVFGHELAVATADSVVLFNLTGAFAGTVPLGVTLPLSDFTGSFANDLFWVWDGVTFCWRGFDIFDTTFSVTCSTGVTDLVLAAGAHTIDTSTGDIDGGGAPAGYDPVTGAFNFNNIDIQAGAMVVVNGTLPLQLLATGNATIDGTIDCDGSPGTSAGVCNSPGSPGGPGGPGGGTGGNSGGNTGRDGTAGAGPGGGGAGLNDSAGGGGGGFATSGLPGTRTGVIGTFGLGGFPYIFILPTLQGGSGGGGGSGDDDAPTPALDPGDDGGGSGGGGGGAVLINAAGFLTVGGTINARGGAGAASGCSGNSGNGGGGSGGYIALVGAGTPTVTGTLDVSGGLGGTLGGSNLGGNGSAGRTFVDTSPCALSCTLVVAAMVAIDDVTVTLDATAMPATSFDSLFEYSLDGGMSWATCTPSATSPLANPAVGLMTGTPVDFSWDALADGLLLPVIGVILRASTTAGALSGTCDTGAFNVDLTCTLALNGTPSSAATAVTVTAIASYDSLFEYSLDGGMTFTTCTAAASSALMNPAMGLTPTPIDFTWDSSLDGVAPPAMGVIVRATATASGRMATCSTVAFDIPLPCLCGDCDLDTVATTILDALRAAQIAAGLIVPSMLQQRCCDTDGSASLTVLDALVMAQGAAGLPVMLTCP